MKIEFSFDDGHPLDFRVQDMLKAYGFERHATFYIPSRTLLTWDDIAILSQHSRIGGHTVHHPMDMKLLSDENMRREIQVNKKELEIVTGKEITSFCYPRGRFDKQVKIAVMQAGYSEARTTRVLRTQQGPDDFEKDTTVQIGPRKEYDGDHWLEVAKEQLNIAQSHGASGYFHVWGHSAEIYDNNDWHHFEALLKLLSNHK